ncbi:MAG: pyruvate formate lyase family protein [Victivallaceae bacterium]|nr:pyruvate formate lyase family protein [Victivallaceae bacterium]
MSNNTNFRYAGRIEKLLAKKQEQTREKLAKRGSADEDDYGYVLPPDGFLENFRFPFQDENGQFSGVNQWAKNFRFLMEQHPVYCDPDDALAGRWMFMMTRMRRNYKLALAPFPFDYSHLHHDQLLYDITCGIGKDQHFTRDYQIGLPLGWDGLKEKVLSSLDAHRGDPEAEELLNGELDAIAGIQNWIARTAEADPDPERAAINRKLIGAPPETLREACQWIAWVNMAGRTYNRDGSGGRIDRILQPYYERDVAAGRIDDEDAIFYSACLLLNDPHMYQIAGIDEQGNDCTCKMSYLILEAARMLKTTCNITVCVHRKMDRALFRRAVEILIENKLGYPRFSGGDQLVDGFLRNGYSKELARQRIALGCNWMSIPGREYTLNDTVKINLAKVFSVALAEEAKEEKLSLERLYRRYCYHMRKAVLCVAEGLDFHMSHQYRNEPELILNLFCHGPIEKGRDASHGGVEFYNLCCDGAGLAVVADSFAALQKQIVEDGALSWEQCVEAIASDFGGADGEIIRATLASTPKFGSGNSSADAWAKKLSRDFSDWVSRSRTPDQFRMIPGLFSWADTVRFGKTVPATPNGRHAGEPISHGANPCNGFAKNAAATAAALAVASIQPGYGNTAPLQLEIDQGFLNCPEPEEKLMALFEGHFLAGGTLINVNIVDANCLRAALKEPEKFPDLIVRVTGFSAYFMMLSPAFRKLIVDRVLECA